MFAATWEVKGPECKCVLRPFGVQWVGEGPAPSFRSTAPSLKAPDPSVQANAVPVPPDKVIYGGPGRAALPRQPCPPRALRREMGTAMGRSPASSGPSPLSSQGSEQRDP